MFLFTDIPQSASPTPLPADTPVGTALHDAAGRTGVSFDYLVKTAQRESSMDPTAKATGSSATGLFQFLEQTWLGLVKSDGAKLGMADASNAVVTTGDGKLTITDPDLKAKVLALRENPETAATAAGVFTAKNREVLTGALGREPSEGELYIAHFLGAGGAAQLIQLASVKPGAKAAGYFGDAAAANRNLFYEKSGRPRTTAEVYFSLIAAHENARPAAQAVQVAAATETPAPANVASDAPPGKPLLGLFRSLPDSAASSVRSTWSSLPRKASVVEGPRASYFPRGESEVASLEGEAPAAAAAEDAPAATAQPVKPADVPLPPVRALAAGVHHARRARAQMPLDLLSFTRVKG